MIYGITGADSARQKCRSVQANLTNPGIGYTTTPKIKFIGGYLQQHQSVDGFRTIGVVTDAGSGFATGGLLYAVLDTPIRSC